jgi:hypothetical protein
VRQAKATPKRKTPKRKTGRKLLPIDPTVVEGMASVGATDVEIAHFVGAGEETIRRRFGAILLKSRSGMRLRLRQAQYKLALDGNPTMCIWLGKQMLGQRDSLTTLPIDPTQMSTEQLERLVKGDDPLQVLASPKGPTA